MTRGAVGPKRNFWCDKNILYLDCDNTSVTTYSFVCLKVVDFHVRKLHLHKSKAKKYNDLALVVLIKPMVKENV